MAENPIPQQELLNRVYKGFNKTGDNIDSLTVVPYVFGTNSQWSRPPAPLIDGSYDYVGFSNPDANGNYQTIVFNNGGSGGTLVRTLSLTYDGSSNITSIART